MGSLHRIKTSHRFSVSHFGLMFFLLCVLAHTKHNKEPLTGVALSNLALVYHARAIERGTTSLVLTAFMFYGMAAAVIQNYNEVNSCDHWILLALYNSMAHIYSSRSRLLLSRTAHAPGTSRLPISTTFPCEYLPLLRASDSITGNLQHRRQPIALTRARHYYRN
jgi:hypothetical protein